MCDAIAFLKNGLLFKEISLPVLTNYKVGSELLIHVIIIDTFWSVYIYKNLLQVTHFFCNLIFLILNIFGLFSAQTGFRLLSISQRQESQSIFCLEFRKPNLHRSLIYRFERGRTRMPSTGPCQVNINLMIDCAVTSH